MNAHKIYLFDTCSIKSLIALGNDRVFASENPYSQTRPTIVRRYWLPLTFACAAHLALVFWPSSTEAVQRPSPTKETATQITQVTFFSLTETHSSDDADSSEHEFSEASANHAKPAEPVTADLLSGLGIDWRSVPSVSLHGLTDPAALAAPAPVFGKPALSDGSLSFSGIFSSAPGDRINTPPPPYPPTARNERREGVVELDVVITASGQAQSAVLLRSSGHEDLDRAARETVLSKWRFIPDRTGGLQRQIVRVAFELTDQRS